MRSDDREIPAKERGLWIGDLRGLHGGVDDQRVLAAGARLVVLVVAHRCDLKLGDELAKMVLRSLYDRKKLRD